jgi:hypothetical protein
MARGAVSNYAQQGGQAVSTNGFLSTTKVQKSYPGATVSVYLTGTSTLATLYSDSGGTAKANPFTASSTDASFLFYVDGGTYDITFSGTVVGTPFTWTGISVGADILSVSVTGMGAKWDGTTDDTVAVQAAMSFSGPHQVFFPAGTGLITDTINIAQSRVQIFGQGEQTTIVNFVPTSGGKPVFKFSNGASVIAQCSITGFGFSSTNATLQKIMVEIDDGEEFDVSHLASAGGTAWTGNTSEGVRIKGRQFVHLHDCTLNTDLPVHLMQNPNVAALDTDHFYLENLYLTADSNPNILADAAVVTTNMTILHNAWVKGSGGFKWQSSSATASNTLTIRDVRWEQEQSATGYLLEIGATGTLNGLKIDSVYGGTSGRGVKLRKVNFATIENYEYIGSGVGLDVDSTVDSLVLMNVQPGFSALGATVSITGQTQILLFPQPVQSQAARPVAFYQSTASSNPSDVLIHGVHYLNLTGTLNNGANTNLVAFFTGAEKNVTFTVSARNNTSNAVEGGVVVGVPSGAGNLAAVGATANFGVGNVPTKLTLLWSGVNVIQLLNQLGNAVDYTVNITWF